MGANVVVALGVETISCEVLEKGVVLVVSSQVLPCFLWRRRELDRCSKNLSMSAMNSSTIESTLEGDTIGCALAAILDVEVAP